MSGRSKKLGDTDGRGKRKRLEYLLMLAILVVAGYLIAARVSQFSVRTSLATVEAVSLGVYWDRDCTRVVDSIDWGELYPGNSKRVNVYIRNEGDASADLSFDTTDWQPSGTGQYISLGWDYVGRTLDANDVVPVELKLSVSSSIRGIEAFSFNILVSTVESLFDVSVKINMGLDREGYVVADIKLDSPEILSGGWGGYTLYLSATSNIVVVSARGGDTPYDSPPTISRVGGQIVVSASISGSQGPQMNGLSVAKLKLRLNGPAGAESTIQPTDLNVVDAASKIEYVAAVHGGPLRSVRGDANRDGRISISDAMFIAQFLAGNRPGSDLNLLNAASVNQDGKEGDKVSIADAMIMGQYLAGSRDAF